MEIPHASPGGQVCAARRFLLQEPKIVQIGMGRLAALKTRQAISGKFSEM